MWIPKLATMKELWYWKQNAAPETGEIQNLLL